MMRSIRGIGTAHPGGDEVSVALDSDTGRPLFFYSGRLNVWALLKLA